MARKLALLAIVPVMVLAGCASHSQNNFTVGSVNPTYKTKHPIIIDEKEKTLDIPVASASYDLSRANISAIEGFARQFRQGANGSISMMMPSGSPNESAAHAVRPRIVEALTNSGIPHYRVHMTSYYAAEHGSAAPIRLSFSAVSASVGECGKWPEDLAGANEKNHNYHNFGCANQNNLASMIANPADLLGPRGTTPVDAERRNRIIENYRDGNVGTTTPAQSVF